MTALEQDWRFPVVSPRRAGHPPCDACDHPASAHGRYGCEAERIEPDSASEAWCDCERYRVHGQRCRTSGCQRRLNILGESW